jgi:hypothetical protein
MSQWKIAKYYIPALLAILFRSYVLSMPQTQPPDSASILQARILTGTWPIRKAVANSSGDLVFAGGNFHEGPDGLVLVTPDRVVKIAATGDDAPGRPGLFLQSFGLFRNNVYTGDFSFNDRDELAFVAYLMNCNGPSLEACGVSSPTQNGLFLFSESSRQTIAIAGDPAPGTAGGVFDSLQRTAINTNGTVLFAASIRMPDGTLTGGLFLFSTDRIDKVYVDGDPTPVGPASVSVPGGPQAQPPTFLVVAKQHPMFLADDGTAIFLGYLGQRLDQPVLFRSQDGTISKVIAAGDSAPDGGVLGYFFDVTANSHGDIVFRANSGRPSENERLYYGRKDGSSFKIIGSGETTSTGDTLQFWGYGLNSISPSKVSFSVGSKVNDFGEVLFDSLFQQGKSSGQGLFLFSSGQVRRIAASDGSTEFSLNNLGMAVSTILNGSVVFLYAAGGLSPVLLPNDAAPGTDGESFVWSDWLSLGNSGQVAVHSTVCCGAFKEGIFLGQIGPPPFNIPNGDFEVLGAGGLPEHWQIVWSNSGTGEAFHLLWNKRTETARRSGRRFPVRPFGSDADRAECSERDHQPHAL